METESLLKAASSGHQRNCRFEHFHIRFISQPWSCALLKILHSFLASFIQKLMTHFQLFLYILSFLPFAFLICRLVHSFIHQLLYLSSYASFLASQHSFTLSTNMCQANHTCTIPPLTYYSSIYSSIHFTLTSGWFSGSPSALDVSLQTQERC